MTSEALADSSRCAVKCRCKWSEHIGTKVKEK